MKMTTLMILLDAYVTASKRWNIAVHTGLSKRTQDARQRKSHAAFKALVEALENLPNLTQ